MTEILVFLQILLIKFFSGAQGQNLFANSISSSSLSSAQCITSSPEYGICVTIAVQCKDDSMHDNFVCVTQSDCSYIKNLYEAVTAEVYETDRMCKTVSSNGKPIVSHVITV